MDQDEETLVTDVKALKQEAGKINQLKHKGSRLMTNLYRLVADLEQLFEPRPLDRKQSEGKEMVFKVQRLSESPWVSIDRPIIELSNTLFFDVHKKHF